MSRPLTMPLVLLALASLVAMMLSVGVGSVSVAPGDVVAVILGEGSHLQQTLVLELRLPRTLSAFATGGLLAVAGALMQVLLRNPLADPYVLGLSGGAAVGALFAMLAGLGGLMISGSAFAGALLATLMVFGLAHGTGSWTPSRLLLTGVVVAAGWGAVITLMLAISPAQRLPGMLYWLMGDVSYARTPWPALAFLVLVCLLVVPLGRSLNVLARGPMQAAALGVAVRPLEWTIYILASLLTATAVTMAGSIGFVGLVVPHMLRLVLGNDQRLILPACALAGGTLLVLADTLARVVIAPEQARQLVIDIPGRGDGEALNFAVEPGQIWGVLGPNGAGKTTLLHTLAGLRAPRHGSVCLGEHPLADLKRRTISQQLGMVFQERQDGFPATVLETALIGRHPWLSPWQMESGADERLARGALEQLDVGHLSDRLVNTLSGGERQRVAIATVLTQAPDTWLLDEPTNHLDLHHQVSVLQLLTEQARSGRSVFMCLHDLNLAARWCDHLLLLYPNGEACWGPAERMLVPAALERLYDQELLTVDVDGAPLFVPVKY